MISPPRVAEEGTTHVGSGIAASRETAVWLDATCQGVSENRSNMDAILSGWSTVC